jgi:UDP-3-O-[3-hydroxymyristoyl] glucosamine N-acyltransferase
MSLTTAEIADLVGGQLQGPGDLTIDRLQTLDRAQPGHLTFIGDQKHAQRWPDCQASAALVDASVELAADDRRALVRVEQVDLAMARLLEAFAPQRARPQPGVHESAVIDPAAKIGRDVTIGPHCLIEAGVTVEDRAVLHHHVSLLRESHLGSNAELWPGVVIGQRCTVGAGSILHSNVVIGTDGFGYRPSPDGSGLVKIPHIGAACIGRDVEIGAGTCVDRGKFDHTTIGDGTKIDNLVQVGHNCRIGRCVVIAGSTALAGSVTIGDGARIGGMVAVKDHVAIGAGAQLAGGAQVMNDVPAGQTWGGSPAREVGIAAREYVAIRKLPELLRKLRRLEKQLPIDSAGEA